MVALARKSAKMRQVNTDFSESYDSEDDIYYVTFNTGEPSFVEEEDDVLLWEIGIFTGEPTGFRILNFSKNVGSIELSVEDIEERFAQSDKKRRSSIKSRAREIQRSLKKVLTAG